MDTLAAALTLVGILLTLLGIVVIRSWLESLGEAVAEKRQGLARWLADQRLRLRHWWTRKRGGSVEHHVHVGDVATVTDSATVTVRRGRVNRDEVTDREWLEHLDDRLYWLIEQFDQGRFGMVEQEEKLRAELTHQGDEFRAEMRNVVRDGWWLAAAGLSLQALGALITIID
jgi:hypothetical protein